MYFDSSALRVLSFLSLFLFVVISITIKIMDCYRYCAYKLLQNTLLWRCAFSTPPKDPTTLPLAESCWRSCTHAACLGGEFKKTSLSGLGGAKRNGRLSWRSLARHDCCNPCEEVCAAFIPSAEDTAHFSHSLPTHSQVLLKLNIAPRGAHRSRAASTPLYNFRWVSDDHNIIHIYIMSTNVNATVTMEKA